MLIYYGLIASVGLISFLSFFIKGQEKRNKIVVFVSCFLIFIIQALRDPTVGVDIEGYLWRFDSMSRFSLLESKEIYFNFEWGYLVYSKVLSFILPNSQWYLAVVALTVIGFIGYVIYKNSKMPGLSILLYITLGLFTFSFSGLRQSIAMGITFLSFEFIKKQKPFHFIACVLLASMFHYSALIFIIAYPLYKLRIRRIHLFWIYSVGFLMFLLKDQIVILIVSRFFPIYSGYLQPTDAYNMLFIMFLVCTLAILFGPNSQQDNRSNGYRNFMLAATVIQIFASESNVIIRMGFYFFIFITLLIPDIINAQKDVRIRITASIITIVAVIVFYHLTTSGGYLNVVPYKVFWN